MIEMLKLTQIIEEHDGKISMGTGNVTNVEVQEKKQEPEREKILWNKKCRKQYKRNTKSEKNTIFNLILVNPEKRQSLLFRKMLQKTISWHFAIC